MDQHSKTEAIKVLGILLYSWTFWIKKKNNDNKNKNTQARLLCLCIKAFRDDVSCVVCSLPLLLSPSKSAYNDSSLTFQTQHSDCIFINKRPRKILHEAWIWNLWTHPSVWGLPTPFQPDKHFSSQEHLNISTQRSRASSNAPSDRNAEWNQV